MIEVEKKYPLDTGDRERITKGRMPFKTVTLVDTYYDDDDFSISTKDRWLRKRNGTFELKVPLHSASAMERDADQFDEIEDEDGIRKFFNIARYGSLDEDIANAGYRPFGTIVTTREKYRINDLTLDVDSIDYGYELCEIESMVERPEDMDRAIEKIRSCAHMLGLVERPLKGKVFEFINRTNPKHYQALVDAGLIDR